MLLVVGALLWLILPQIYSSVNSIVSNSQSYFETIEGWVTRTFEDYPELMAGVTSLLDSASGQLTQWATNTLLPQMTNIISSITSGVYTVVRGMKKKSSRTHLEQAYDPCIRRESCKKYAYSGHSRRHLPHGGEKISVIGMGSSVIGGGNRQQLRQVLGFLEAPAEQRDYSAINDALAQMDADGTLSRLSVKYFGMDISEEQ